MKLTLFPSKNNRVRVSTTAKGKHFTLDEMWVFCQDAMAAGYPTSAHIDVSPGREHYFDGHAYLITPASASVTAP